MSGVKKTSRCDVFRREVCSGYAANTADFLQKRLRPSTSSSFFESLEYGLKFNMGEFPSGQRGQTVNLLRNRFDGSNPSSPTKLEEYHRKVGALLIFG